jgi:hypothetical protein
MNGEFLVADTMNHRVRAVVLAVSPNANAGGQSPTTDGRGPSATPSPELGKAVVLAPRKGTVRIRRPRGKRFVALTESTQVPTGSTIDARRGTVALSSALDREGKTQTAQFWAGVFQVRQARSGRGMTDIILRGARPSCRTSRAKASISARRGRRRGAKLWAKDKRGRFRTRGGNSVATTRGTLWLTQERCTGTVTKVLEGSVIVRNRKTGRKVRVRAGKSYLARRQP